MRARALLLLIALTAAAHAAPPGFVPRDAGGGLIGPALVDAMHADWAAHGVIMARAQNPFLAKSLDTLISAGNEIHAGSQTRKRFLEELGAITKRPHEDWLALGTLDERAEIDSGAIEIIATGKETGVVRMLVDRKNGRALLVVRVPLDPLPFALKVSAGHSIEGDTYEFTIDHEGRLHFERITPTTWKPDMTRDRLLLPEERSRLVEIVAREKIASVSSQDFHKHPMMSDQGYYVLDFDGSTHTHAQIGMSPVGPAIGDELHVQRLLAVLGTIVEVEIR